MHGKFGAYALEVPLSLPELLRRTRDTADVSFGLDIPECWYEVDQYIHSISLANPSYQQY